MPLDADARRALLDRILASGDRRRRRWLLGPSTVVVAVIALLVALLPGDGASSRLDVSVEGTETTTTLDGSDTSPDTTEAPETGSTTSPPDESTSTSTSTSAAPVCRNSHDPRCGPFYWDYDPATWPNAPLELSISHEPATIVAGEQVTFSIRFYDPDVAHADNCARSWFPGSDAVPDHEPGYSAYEGEGGEFRFLCAVPMCVYPDRHGPWDPPPPETSAPVTKSVTRVYQEPGEYTVRVEAESRWWCRFEGYDSAATHSITVRVVAPPML